MGSFCSIAGSYLLHLLIKISLGSSEGHLRGPQSASRVRSVGNTLSCTFLSAAVRGWGGAGRRASFQAPALPVVRALGTDGAPELQSLRVST